MARKQYMTGAAMPIVKNRTHHKAVRLLAKCIATLDAMSLCPIPTCTAKLVKVEYEDGTTAMVNPDIKPNGNGSKVGPASSEYIELRESRKKYLREHYRTRTRSKTPWYMLTSGKCWNNGTRTTSETGMYNYTIPKFSREQYIVGLAKAECENWEKTHPMPLKEIDGTKNAFYQTEYSQWVNDRANVWETKMCSIKNKPKNFLNNLLKQVRPDLLKTAA